jgi:WhiB family redox-sensing transcriptional regulator
LEASKVFSSQRTVVIPWLAVDRLDVLWLMAPETSDLDEVIESLVGRPSWHQWAACRGADLPLFFPDRDKSAKPALALCADCPVRLQCQQEALSNPLVSGVWGGTTPRDRKQLRRRRGAA